MYGAIFYRYRRLEISYDRKAYKFFGYNTKVSSLSQVLNETFKLEKNLDEETLATCCEAYKAYLLQPDNLEGHKIVADQFPYIKNDPKFLTNLNEIISIARTRAKPLTRQLLVISFVQSVGQLLQETDKKLLILLPQVIQLVTDQREKKELLRREDILELINSQLVAEENLKKVLTLSLPEELGLEGVLVNGSYYLSFQDYLLQAININSKYTLLGAYVIALSRCNFKMTNLRDALNISINSILSNQLDDEAKDLGLNALKNYISCFDKPNLDCRSWDEEKGGEFLMRDLEIRQNNLRKISPVSY